MTLRRNLTMDLHRRRRKLENAIRPVSIIEQLENRCLLTTLAGGGIDNTDPTNPIPLIGDVFFMKDPTGQVIRITMAGDIEADFVGVSVDDMGNVVVQDLVQNA